MKPQLPLTRLSLLVAAAVFAARSPVSLIEYHYECPFKFTGKINRLTYTLGPPEFTEAKK